jgi:hypothetical protein
VDELQTDQPFVENDDWRDDEDDEVRGGRRWPIIVISVVFVIVVIGVALFLAASHYQPLSQNFNGEYGSQVLTSNGSLATNTFVEASRAGIVWTEPSGSYRVEVIVTLNNDQRFGITVNKVMAPENPSGNADVRVYFDSKPSSPGAYSYKGGPAFTATTLASEGQLVLAVHWQQQCVPESAKGTSTTYTDLPVEYTFMGFHHTVTVPIHALTIKPRATC